MGADDRRVVREVAKFFSLSAVIAFVRKFFPLRAGHYSQIW